MLQHDVMSRYLRAAMTAREISALVPVRLTLARIGGGSREVGIVEMGVREPGRGES